MFCHRGTWPLCTSSSTLWLDVYCVWRCQGVDENDQRMVLQGAGMTMTNNKNRSEVDSVNSGQYIAYENKDDPP